MQVNIVTTNSTDDLNCDIIKSKTETTWLSAYYQDQYCDPGISVKQNDIVIWDQHLVVYAHS